MLTPILFPMLIATFLLLKSFACFAHDNDKKVQQILTNRLAEIKKGIVESPKENCHLQKDTAKILIDPISLCSQTPTPVEFDSNSSECKEWRDAHRVCCQESTAYDIAQSLLMNVNYISNNQFKAEMEKTIHSFALYRKAFPLKRYVLVIDPNKSSEWLAGQNYQLLSKVIQPGGLDIIAREHLDDYYNQPGHEDVDILQIDDAIYSGLQMYYTFIHGPKNSNSHQIFNHLSEKIKLHILIPFATNYGRENIQDALRKKVVFNNFYISQKIESIKEFLPLKLQKTFTEIYGANRINSTITFFEHKVPDSLSVPSQFFQYGKISCPSISTAFHPFLYEECKLLSYACIPKILSPYGSDKAFAANRSKYPTDTNQSVAKTKIKACLQDHKICDQILTKTSTSAKL